MARGGSLRDSFQFGGYHFTPYRKFRKREGDFFSICQRIRSDRELGLWTYEGRKADYTYDSFYAASTDKSCDLFICAENGKVYVPCINEMFEYMEPRQRNHSPNQRKSALDALEQAKKEVADAPPAADTPGKSDPEL